MEELETILADVKQEGSDPFADMDKAPSESLPEKTEEELAAEATAKAEAEDNVPFHKHPRWQQREQEMTELREANEATSRELADLRSMKETSTDSVEIPSWFAELYGENEVAWKKYEEHEAEKTQQIESNILERQRNDAQKEVDEAKHWEGWVETQMDDLEDKGETFDRNRLTKVMIEYSPTDADNNLDFTKGLAIYQALEGKSDNSAKSEAKKILGDQTTKSTTKGEAPKKKYMTSAQLRNTSWGQL